MTAWDLWLLGVAIFVATFAAIAVVAAIVAWLWEADE